MAENIRQVVQTKYASVAKSGLSSDHSGVRAVAEAFGYTPDQLASIPAEANMGLSCGNPTAFASLRPGETVVDLGCGGGLDVFLAAARVGPTGKAIGIDMTPEMIERARHNAAKGVEGKPITNAEFHLATIDQLPLPDASVDCVISNCVINLAPDKPAVFREIVRVLKPGGRLAVSDIALKKPLPPEVGSDLMAYVGCIAGAILIEQYRSQLLEAGFAHVDIIDMEKDLNAYTKVEGPSDCCSSSGTSAVSSSCCSSSPSDDTDLHRRLADVLRRYHVNDFAASVRVYAVKPTGTHRKPKEEGSVPEPKSSNSSAGQSIFTPAVAELVAIGAAIGANCEPCLKHHYNEAKKLGVSRDDMALAVELADRVKRAPAQNMRVLADKLLGTTIASQAPVDPNPGCCCSSAGETPSVSKTSKTERCRCGGAE